MCISFRKLSIRVDFRRNQARTVASFIVMIVGGGQPLAKNLDKQKKKEIEISQIDDNPYSWVGGGGARRA